MTDIQQIYDGYFERMKSMATTLKFLKDTMDCFEYDERKKLETLVTFLSKELEELAVNISETGAELIKREGLQGHGEKCTSCEKVCNTFSASAGDLPTPIFHSDGTGKVRWYCLECVITKIGV